MRDLSGLREQVTTWHTLTQSVADASELLEMAVESDDPELIAEIAADAARLRKQYDGARVPTGVGRAV